MIYIISFLLFLLILRAYALIHAQQLFLDALENFTQESFVITKKTLDITVEQKQMLEKMLREHD